jgi:hypothetical protein
MNNKNYALTPERPTFKVIAAANKEVDAITSTVIALGERGCRGCSLLYYSRA